MCEQSFHFSNAGGLPGKILPSESDFSETQTHRMLDGVNPQAKRQQQAMLFANYDDAKTLSLADGTQ